MPKVAYSEEERAKIRDLLVRSALKLIAKQGVQNTTVQQIYDSVGISRTFFYSFFPSKEDLIVETLYMQQPKIIAYAKSLSEDKSLSWREAVCKFLFSCCYGEKNGIAVLSLQEQQIIFRRLSSESYRTFRQKQMRLFGSILECFGIRSTPERTALFINLALSMMVLRKAIPETMPLLVPEAADATTRYQISSIADCLEKMKNADSAEKK